jgi:hypothetical protein
LNRGIADGDVLPNRIAACSREHHDAVRVTDRGIGFNEVVVAGCCGDARTDANAKISRRARRVAVSARLVPPERVIASLNSYPATRSG